MRRLALLSSATLALLARVCGVARAQGEIAAALARPVPDFDTNVVTSTIRANLSRLREVYEHRLRSNPRLSRRINLEFRVSCGLVIDDVVVTENTTGDEAFGKEISAALLAFDWPSTSLLGGSVRFSFHSCSLRSSGSGAAEEGRRGPDLAHSDESSVDDSSAASAMLTSQSHTALTAGD